MEEINSKIKNARLKLGLTQTETATVLGIPRRTLQNWEIGAASPSEWLERLIVEKIEGLNQKEITTSNKTLLEVEDLIRGIISEHRNRITYTDVEEFRKQGAVSVLEDLLNKLNDESKGE